MRVIASKYRVIGFGLAVELGLAVLAYVLLSAFDCNGPGFTPVLVITISGHSQSHCFHYFSCSDIAISVNLKPYSITLASSELAPNMFEASSCQIQLH